AGRLHKKHPSLKACQLPEVSPGITFPDGSATGEERRPSPVFLPRSEGGSHLRGVPGGNVPQISPVINVSRTLRCAAQAVRPFFVPSLRTRWHGFSIRLPVTTNNGDQESLSRKGDVRRWPAPRNMRFIGGTRIRMKICGAPLCRFC